MRDRATKTSFPAGPRLVWAGRTDRVPEPPVSRTVPLELLPAASRDSGWRNRLIHGDNLRALASLRRELAGKVEVIYIDPPFATGASFSFRAELGGKRPSAEPARSVASTAYHDDWGPDRSGWFSMMAERLVLARELLSPSGTIYVHVDWNAGHHLRALLDEIFGARNSLGEIVWAYGSPSGGRSAGRKLVKSHDFILAFARNYGRQQFQPVYLPYSERYLEEWFRFSDEDGRRYRKRWRRAKDGSSYFEKQYLDRSKGVPASTVWTDIQQVYADPRAYKAGMTSEVTGYPTQKPLKLLERILAISSSKGDLVLDFFSGSGTTLVAAERTGRRWIGCDVGAQAVQLAARRILALPSAAPFVVERVEGTRTRAASSLPTAILETRDGAVRIRLDGRGKWRERVERWSVGSIEGGALATRWTAFRTLKDRALPLASPWLDGYREPPAVEIVDVLGRTARLSPIA